MDLVPLALRRHSNPNNPKNHPATHHTLFVRSFFHVVGNTTTMSGKVVRNGVFVMKEMSSSNALRRNASFFFSSTSLSSAMCPSSSHPPVVANEHELGTFSARQAPFISQCHSSTWALHHMLRPDSKSLRSGASLASNFGSSSSRRAFSTGAQSLNFIDDISSRKDLKNDQDKVENSNEGETTRRRSRLRATPSVLTLTAGAAKRIKELIEGKDDVIGIRITVKKRGCNGYSYNMNYATTEEQSKRKDEIVEMEGVKVFVDPAAVFFIVGTEMNYEETELAAEFTFTNPNSKGECGCGESFNV